MVHLQQHDWRLDEFVLSRLQALMIYAAYGLVFLRMTRDKRYS